MYTNTVFWSRKRLEAISRTSLTLFQAFLIAGLLGGAFGKLTAAWLKTLFVATMLAFLSIGAVFSDWPLKLKKEI